MVKKSSARGRSKSAGKIEALKRAQQINELLLRSTIESEALQSSGDDRPIGEQHLSDLLNQDRSERKLQNIVSRDFRRPRRLSRRMPRRKAVRKAKGKKTKRRR